MVRILLFICVIIIFLFLIGCSPQQQYVCSDGTTVLNPSLCPEEPEKEVTCWDLKKPSVDVMCNPIDCSVILFGDDNAYYDVTGRGDLGSPYLGRITGSGKVDTNIAYISKAVIIDINLLNHQNCWPKSIMRTNYTMPE